MRTKLPALSALFVKITSRFALAAALLSLGGCSLVRAIAGARFERPTLAYESWSADQLDLDGVTIALHYRLENPNDTSLDLRRLSYRLEVQGRQVAEGQVPAGVQLRAKGATPIAIPVRLRWRDVPGILELLVTRTEIAYRVTGNAGVGSPIGTIDLPFDHRDHVALPRSLAAAPPAHALAGASDRPASPSPDPGLL